MSKSIWHNKKEKPAKKLHCNRLIITKWGSCLDEIDIDNGATIETDWAFLDDLLALETANKDLSDKIGKLETELDRTRKALDAALDKLKRIRKIYTNAPFNAPIDYAKVCTDMYDVATEQIKD